MERLTSLVALQLANAELRLKLRLKACVENSDQILSADWS
jgi:hypothetical protein